MTDFADIEIRTATIDDLSAIFHLGEKLFTAQDHSNLYRTWDEFEVTSLFNSEPENLLVADTGEHVAGFAMGTIINKSRSAWTYGHLLWLGVDADIAGHGVGSALFNRFRDIMELQGVRMLMIDTQIDNSEALAFFRKKGFENPIEHVYMTLNLQRNES